MVQRKSIEPAQIDLQTEHVVQERGDLRLDSRVDVCARDDYTEPGRIRRLHLSDGDL